MTDESLDKSLLSHDKLYDQIFSQSLNFSTVNSCNSHQFGNAIIIPQQDDCRGIIRYWSRVRTCKMTSSL